MLELVTRLSFVFFWSELDAQCERQLDTTDIISSIFLIQLLVRNKNYSFLEYST